MPSLLSVLVSEEFFILSMANMDWVCNRDERMQYSEAQRWNWAGNSWHKKARILEINHIKHFCFWTIYGRLGQLVMEVLSAEYGCLWGNVLALTKSTHVAALRAYRNDWHPPKCIAQSWFMKWCVFRWLHFTSSAYTHTTLHFWFLMLKYPWNHQIVWIMDGFILVSGHNTIVSIYVCQKIWIMFSGVVPGQQKKIPLSRSLQSLFHTRSCSCMDPTFLTRFEFPLMESFLWRDSMQLILISNSLHPLYWFRDV